MCPTILIRSLKPVKSEHWLMLSILIYVLTGILKNFLFLPLVNMIMLYASFMFIWFLFKFWKQNPLPGLVGAVYVILIIWSFLLTMHMFLIAEPGHTDVSQNITSKLLKYFGSAYFFPNLLPFMLFCLPKYKSFDFRYFWRIMWLLCILYLCFAPFSLYNMLTFKVSASMFDLEFGEKGSYGDFISNSTMGIGNLSPLILMVYFKKYLTNKHWKYFLLTQIIALFITVYLGRRGSTTMILIYFISAWWMYLYNDKKTNKFKNICLALIVIGLIYTIFESGQNSLFSVMSQRGDEDTRTAIEGNLIDDLNINGGWILGRGWMGEYYAPEISDYRRMIETGYLGMILKGGFLYLISYLIILGVSAYKGYFKSKSLFCKSFALIIFIQILSLKPFGHPAFNFSHFAVWLGVWICNSKYFLRLTDSEVKSKIF